MDNHIKEIPLYYIGKHKKIKAIDVCMDFELSYNLGTAVTYLLRAGKKEGNSEAHDIKKAIHHLQFQLESLDN